MQIVYLIAGQGERDAISSSLSSLPCKVECFPNVAALLAESGHRRNGLRPDRVAAGGTRPDGAPSGGCGAASDHRSVRLRQCSARGQGDERRRRRRRAKADRSGEAPRRGRGRARREPGAGRAGAAPDGSCARFRSLSARERDVVDAVLDGRGNREVAAQLGIKPRTVEIHRAKAMSKLGARTLADLVRIWLDVDENTARLSAE